MNLQRINNTRLALEAEGIDALICRLPENVLLLSGYYSLTGFSFILFPAAYDPVLFVYKPELPYAEKGWVKDIRTFGWALREDQDVYQSIRTLLKAAVSGMELKTIGFEGGFESIAPPHMSGEPLIPGEKTFQIYREVFKDNRLLDTTELLYSMRTCKTDYELEKLRIANEVAAFGLKAFYEGLIPGKTETQLSAEVESAIYSKGVGHRNVSSARGWAEVMSGPENSASAYRMFLISTGRKLETGDLVLLELGTMADGYWSDLTRTGVVGEPNLRQAEIWNIVLSAQTAAVSKLRPGLPACGADIASSKVFQENGIEKYYPHFTGHGLGFRYHEPFPMLRVDNEIEKLMAGMVTSVEPGIYIPGFGGIRIEDDVVIMPEGAEYLSTFPRGLAI